MTQYQLYMKSGVPKSTIGNIINCSYDSVKLRIIHEMCQGNIYLRGMISMVDNINRILDRVSTYLS